MRDGGVFGFALDEGGWDGGGKWMTRHGRAVPGQDCVVAFSITLADDTADVVYCSRSLSRSVEGRAEVK